MRSISNWEVKGSKPQGKKREATNFWWYPGDIFLIMAAFADLGTPTKPNITYVIILELCSLAPYKRALTPSTPAHIGEA